MSERICVEVENVEEGDQLKAGLADPMTRALVKIIGALQALDSDRARRRVLTFVADKVAEQAPHA